MNPANVLMEKDGNQTLVSNDSSVQVMENNGWKIIKGSVKPTVAAENESDADKRAREDEGARNATAAQLKDALAGLDIKFASNASKADLLALFLNR